MSNYRALAYHPVTGRLEVAEWHDVRSSGGTNRNGYPYLVRLSDWTESPSAEVRQPDPVALFEIAQEMAEALDAFDDGGDTDSAFDPKAFEDAMTALSRWREFTKEKKDG